MRTTSPSLAKASQLTIDHERGCIPAALARPLSDPASKAKSVVMTEEGVRRTRELFEKHFALAA